MSEQPALTADVTASFTRTVRDLVKAERERDEARAEVERHKRHCDEAVATWRQLYHEAVGVPPSEHQARRLEDMATKAESVAAERDEALSALARVRALADEWDGYGTSIVAAARRSAAAALRAALEVP